MADVAQVPFNPADLTDPDAQRKTAEDVLSQLGLHPNQAGARNLLDMHFQGPTADPDIQNMINVPDGKVASAPLAASVQAPITDYDNKVASNPAVTPQSVAEAHQQAVNYDKSQIPDPTKIVSTVDHPLPANAPQSALFSGPNPLTSTTPSTPSTSSAPLINIPSPGSTANPIVGNTNSATVEDQNELRRLIKTGSGISQLHNPFERALGHIGEIGLDFFAPGLASAVPGTDMHHGELIHTQQGLVNSDLRNAQEEATTAHTEQETQASKDDAKKNPNELGIWVQQNPGKPISDYWKQKTNAEGGKLTPQEIVMKNLTAPVEEGGQGMTPEAAFKQMNNDLASTKATTPGALKVQMTNTLAKAFPDGELDPQVISNPKALSQLISTSDNLTPKEKADLSSYFTINNSPASAGGVASTRAGVAMDTHPSPSIDRTTGNLTYATPRMIADSPDRYIPATQGSQSLSKEAVFGDIHYNVNQTREAMNNLQNGFSPQARAQIALALRSSDAHKAFAKFMDSEVAGSLTPDQVDYVTSLASLNENAMAMRSVAGMGQGSDDLRAAIMKALPGAGTPDKDYGNRQLDLFEGTLNRLEGGVAHTGVKQPPIEEAPKTGSRKTGGQQGSSQPTPRVFTHDQVQAAADAAGISYEDAKKDAIAQGHQVVDNGSSK